jgi:hypothetical protein
MTQIFKPIRLSPCALVICAVALAGCDREKISVQQVPKDSEQTAQMPLMSQPTAGGMPANPHAGMDMNGAGAQPQVKWTLPEGWKEKAVTDMRVGSFDAGKEGKTADVSIIPLQLGSGPQMELANYNLWRESLQLDPVDKVSSEPVAVGSVQGKLYEIADSKTPERIVVAMLERNGVSWFFKMKGPDAVVSEQKPAFMQFLKSISFEAAPQMTAMADPQATMPAITADAAPANATTSASGVALPAGWKEIPNPPMLLAKYVIQGSSGAMADVNVSMLNGTGGGVMPNVTRWRVQLGVPPISEEEFSKQAQTVDVAGVKGTMVDMTGTDSKTGKKARLVGIIVPQVSDTWFYKLMGDPQIVEQQKDTFIKFIQTAKFSNAP